MFVLFSALAFAEPAISNKAKKSQPLRIGGCVGLAHCPMYGVELSHPQLMTKHLGIKTALSFSPKDAAVGGGLALTFSFNKHDKRYDPYLSIAGLYATDISYVLSCNYGAYIQIIKDSPLYLDFQAGLSIGEGSFLFELYPSGSLSLLWGGF